jgi:hypothetical protein
MEPVLAGAVPVNGRGRAKLGYQGNMSAEEVHSPRLGRRFRLTTEADR